MKTRETHSWIRPISLAYMPGERTPALDSVTDAILSGLRAAGCTVSHKPDETTELILTTTRYGMPIDQNDSLVLHAKRRYRLPHRPQVLTIIDMPETDYQGWLAHFESLVAQSESGDIDYNYPELGPRAVEVLLQQAQRGGPEVALGRFLQAYVKSFRVMALRSDDKGHPLHAVHFDLAGAHPTSDAANLAAFAEEVGLRILAATVTEEVNNHEYHPDPLPKERWDRLKTPEAMVAAGRRFTEFGFFTDPVSIEKLLGYRAVNEAVSAQYSEGCYAVFDVEIPGLVTTATGSAKLVDKRFIERSDQAIVLDVREEGTGAVVRPVEGMDRVAPSVEAVEMMSICKAVPFHERTNSRGERVQVPNVRAILHGHLGVASFDPDYVESVRLAAPYYTHLVSCGTGALAMGTSAAFAGSEALRTLDDSRAVIFVEQPGHGVVIVEKWVEGTEPFDLIYDYLSQGRLRMTMTVPQGVIHWKEREDTDGRRIVEKVLTELAGSQI